MNPDAQTLWRGPRWRLAVLLACLGMLGPFSIDTYLPAFTGIAASLGATPVQMQQTLSAYLFGFAVLNLFHGALSDSVGRKPVILVGIGMFTLASVGCALSESIGQLVFFRALQGMSAGAGMVVSRAIIRDMFPPADAQRVMSQVTIFFGIAPAVAPLFGGWLFVALGWHAVFWFLAVIGAALWLLIWQRLPETLHPDMRQPVAFRPLMRGYWQMGTNLQLPDAGAGQRHPVQRHVPVCAERTGVAGRGAAAAAHAVLLVLPAQRGGHHARCLRVGPAGRAAAAEVPDPPRLHRHARGVAAQRGAEPDAAAAPESGRC